jgi:Ca-activated chloride channel homolog
MGGEPLAAARTAIADLVRRLSPQDHFGLVTFDDEVVDCPSPSAHRRPALDELLAAIDGVRAGGSTDLSAGYLMGLREADRALLQRRARAVQARARRRASSVGRDVLVLSDGHANAGITDPAARRARHARRRRCSGCSGCGSGRCLDDDVDARARASTTTR